MNFKTLLSKIITCPPSNQGSPDYKHNKAVLLDCINNNDDLAEFLCNCQIPRLMAVIFESDDIRKKAFFEKYLSVYELYSPGMDVSHFCFGLDKIKNDIVPYLNVEQVESLIKQYQIREDIIKTINDSKEDLKTKKKNILEKPIKQKQSDPKDEKTEPISPKKKLNKKDVEKLDDIEHKISKLQEQERFLDSSFNRPSQISEFLKSVKPSILQEIKSRENALLENKNPIVNFEIGNDVESNSDERVNQLQDELKKLGQQNEALKKDNEALKKDIREKTTRNDELSKERENLYKDATRREDELNAALNRISALEPKKKDLERQNKEYDSILKMLNGRIFEVLSEPISILEKLYFNLYDYVDKMDPRDLADQLVEPIEALRTKIKRIELKTTQAKILSHEYLISLDSCASFDDWKDRTPVKYDPKLHCLRIGDAKKVYIITRGFKYTNNLGEEVVIQAEVRPADEITNDEQGDKS